MTPIFKVGTKDLIRGLIVMVLSAIFYMPISELAKYIPFLHYPVIELMVSTIFAYLAKNLSTDEEGKLGGYFQIH